MEETAAGPAKKSGTTLSVDRAAFLLLRVRKVFKKKRQQRKERQAQQSGAAAGGAGGAGGGSGSQSRTGSRKLPPPLLRSRTLPAIIVPGLPVVSLHTDKQTFQLDERLLGSKSRSGSASGHRWSSLLTRATNHSSSGSGSGGGGGGGGSSGGNNATSNNNNNNSHLANNNNTLMVKSLNLPKDDSNLVYRRKSSGSTPHHHQGSHSHHHHTHHQQHLQQQHAHLQHMQHLGDSSLFQLSDDFECHADGSLLLRIPAPHVVAARAYRLAARKRGAASSEASTPLSREPTLHEVPLAEASGSGSSTTFTRLAKLLHQSTALAGRSSLQPPPAGDNVVQSLGLGLGLGLGEEAPRRLSWERRKDSSALQRSASIDSFAEIVFSDLPRSSLAVTAPGASAAGGPSPFSKRPSASSLYSTSTGSSFGSQVQAQLNVNYGDSAAGSGSGGGTGPGHHTAGGNGGSGGSGSRRESMLSPSSTRRSKLTRIINALFSAVEHGHLEKAHHPRIH